MADDSVTLLSPRAVLDVDTGELIDRGYVRVEGDRITAVDTDRSIGSDADEVVELPELTLIPGLMDMEVDLVLGGPGAGLNDPVVTDPVKMTLRATVNARRTLLAGFTTVRNLGLFVKTGGYLLDVALCEAIDAGWVEGPRIVPAGHAHRPDRRPPRPERAERPRPAHDAPVGRGGHRRRGRRGPQGGPLPDQARRQAHQVLRIRRRDRLARPPGAQQYSTEELAAIADEAHRRGLKVAAHCHGDAAVNAALDAGIDCIEHGFMITEPTVQRMVDAGTFLVSTNALTENWDVSRHPPADAGQGRRGVPEGQGVAVDGDRGGREDRVRQRRARRSGTVATPRSWSCSSSEA